jgi:hypothetical protein
LTAWHDKLRRGFDAAGRMAVVELMPLSLADGGPRFWITWHPDPPTRLTAEDIEHFDAELARCKREILRHVASLSEGST